MKTGIQKRILCMALAVLAMAQWSICASAETAGSADGISVYRYIFNVEKDGTWTQGYLADEAGNRVRWGDDAFVAAQSVFPEKYDLRDKQLVTPVKNQCQTGTCWAFGAIAAAESNYITQGYGTAADTDFSESHLVWFSHRPRSVDPTDPLYGEGYTIDNPYQWGGLWQINSAAMMRGSGLQTESLAPWNNPETEEESMEMALPESERYACAAQLWSVESLWELTGNAIKQKIMQNGAASLAFRAGANNYNKEHHCMFQKRYHFADHEVCVVGWDDTFSRKNFSKPRPKADGAWLIKNSWGTEFGEDGYLWLSYEDTSIEEVESYVMAPADVYDNRYQYDAVCPEEVIVGSGSAKMANIFTAREAEELTHVAFFSFNPYPMPATAEVYVGSADAVSADQPLSGMHRIDAATTTVSDVSLGYRTVELRDPVTLQAGETFAVVITLTNPTGESVGVPVEGRNRYCDLAQTFFANPGESFVYVNGAWQDTTAMRYGDCDEPVNMHNVPVKAMTRDLNPGMPVLTVCTEPERKTYEYGESPDLTGLALLYTDENGTQTVVEEGCTCLTPTLAKYGSVPVILSYRGLRAAYMVQVHIGAYSLTLSDSEKKTLRFGEVAQLTPIIQGMPENADLLVRYDLLIDGWYSDFTYMPARDTIRIGIGYPNTESCQLTLTLTDRFGDPITGEDGTPITTQTEYSLKCGQFYQFLYRVRFFFLNFFNYIKRQITD